MRRMMLVAVLVLVGCDEGGGSAGGMGGAPGAGGAPATAQGLTAQEIIATIQDCEDVPGKPPCCPDPVELLDLGGDDGMTIQCPEGFELEDNTTLAGRRLQICTGQTDEGKVRGAFLRLQVDAGERADAADLSYPYVEMGHQFEGYVAYECLAATGRATVIKNRRGQGECIVEAYIDLPPSADLCD